MQTSNLWNLRCIQICITVKNISIWQVTSPGPNVRGLGSYFPEVATFRLPSCRIQHQYHCRDRMGHHWSGFVECEFLHCSWPMEISFSFIIFIGTFGIEIFVKTGLVMGVGDGDSSYQYCKPHCDAKKIKLQSYLHNGTSFNGKTTSLYWIRAQVTNHYCQSVGPGAIGIVNSLSLVELIFIAITHMNKN